jgi:isochorismate hydrolase
VIEWVTKTGKKKLVMAGLWTEVCLQMPVLSAVNDGYEVYFITDASGGASREAHDMAVQRMIQAGAVPTTTWSYVSECNATGVVRRPRAKAPRSREPCRRAAFVFQVPSSYPTSARLS